jgi:hypothetical protein
MPHDEFEKVRSLEDLVRLRPDDVEAGYYYALAGNPEPSQHLVGRSFWHGWRNGCVARGDVKTDDAQDALRVEYALRIVEPEAHRLH